MGFSGLLVPPHATIMRGVAMAMLPLLYVNEEGGKI